MRIETERLVLRPVAQSDLDDFVALYGDPAVNRFIGGPTDRAEVAQRLRAAEEEWAQRGHGSMAILLDGRFIGRAGLRYWPQFGETEVGWVLRADAWGRGYATEAGRACVQWGFANLAVPCLTAMIAPENAASIRVAGRLGLVPAREDVLLGTPVVVYSVTRERWGS